MSLSITLTLSGGAALGAYEAGVTAALVEAVQTLRAADHDVAIDAYGGASAGALVAMFAAHADVNGIDATWLLHTAWVERVSLDLLLGRGLRSPLGFETLEERIDDLLDPRDDAGRPSHRRDEPLVHHAVGLHAALTGLRGLHYPVRSLGPFDPVTATSYADWGGFSLQPGGGVRQLVEPRGRSVLDTVLASAANAVAFAPRALDRSNDRQGYAANGILDLPDPAHLWYTDGGTLQVEPIGRVLTAARKARRETGRPPPDRHLVLLVDPRSELPESQDAWAAPDAPPSWMAGIARTLAILPAQILYDDLRRVEKHNSRLEWADHLAEVLADHLDEDGLAALRAAVEQIEQQQADLTVSDSDARPGPLEDDLGDARSLTGRAVATVAGLHGKHRAAVDVISPVLLTDADRSEVAGLLAGEIVGDFGGFLDRDLRHSDFLLGYDCAVEWLRRNLGRLPIPDALHDHVLEAVGARVDGDWRSGNRGQTRLSDLPLRSRLRLAKLAARLSAVLARDLWSSLRSG